MNAAFVRAIVKLANGLNSHQELINSMMAHHGQQGVSNLINANPGHKSGLIPAAKRTLQVPAVGKGPAGVMHSLSTPLRAAASGVLHTKLAFPTDYLKVRQAVLLKLAGMGENLGHAFELGGLGILARPTIQEMRGQQVSERSKHIHEVAGLGTLAVPSAVGLGAHYLPKLKGLIRR